MTRGFEPDAELRELLRRIEEIPTRAPPAPAPGGAGFDAADAEADRQGEPLAAPIGIALTRPQKHTAWILVGAVGAAAALTAGWSLLVDRAGVTRPSAGMSREGSPPAVSAQPARLEAPAPALASARERPEPPPGAKPAIEARAPAAVPLPPPRPTLIVPAISATAGQRVRVSIRIEPRSFSAGSAELHVRGLPAQARFLKGAFVAPDRWVIAGADLDALELALGDMVEGRFDLTAELRAVDGRPLVEAKSLLVVAAPAVIPAPTVMVAAGPATAVSPAAPVRVAPTAGPAPKIEPAAAVPFSDTDALDEASQEKFLVQGLRLLVTGNINSARLLFQRSAEAGNARAALVLGDTFDDVRLAQLGVLGVLPDRGKSIYWYERADELGAPEAKERLSELNLR